MHGIYYTKKTVAALGGEGRGSSNKSKAHSLEDSVARVSVMVLTTCASENTSTDKSINGSLTNLREKEKGERVIQELSQSQLLKQELLVLIIILSSLLLGPPILLDKGSTLIPHVTFTS